MAEKISCCIAQDLMPLTIDGVCSEESRQAVNVHVAECPSCEKIYQEMRASLLVSGETEHVDNEFSKAMKRQGHKMRWWKIAAICCAVVLLITGLFVVQNPEILFVNQPLPISWVKNAHLVRTKQNVILLQFTPSERYRHFFGMYSYSYGPSSEQGNDDEQNYEASLTLSYPWLARVIPKDFDIPSHRSRYEVYEDRLIRLSNGDWVVTALPMSVQSGWRYQDGKIVTLSYRSLTNEDIVELVKEGTPVTSNTAIYVKEDDWNADSLWLEGKGGKLLVYEKGEEIPLCDEETQQKFDQMILDWPSLYHEEGELVETKG